MDINIEELLKMVEKENQEHKKEIYKHLVKIDELNERLAIQKVEFEEEVEQFGDLINFQKLALTKAEQKLEKIKEIAEKNLQENQCNSCDGVGLGECLDDKCSYYQMDKILEIIESEE